MGQIHKDLLKQKEILNHSLTQSQSKIMNTLIKLSFDQNPDQHLKNIKSEENQFP